MEADALFAFVSQTLPKGIPRSPIYLIGFWAGAFASLGLAMFGLMVFSNIIESDTEFMSFRKEIALALAASALQGAGAWLLGVWAPAGSGRGMLLVFIVSGLLYQVAHYDKWGRFEVPLLILLQLVIVSASVSVVLGQIQFAFFIVGVCVVFLGIFAAIARSL